MGDLVVHALMTPRKFLLSIYCFALNISERTFFLLCFWVTIFWIGLKSNFKMEIIFAARAASVWSKPRSLWEQINLDYVCRFLESKLSSSQLEPENWLSFLLFTFFLITLVINEFGV